MGKRNRDGASTLHAPQQARHDNPTTSPPPTTPKRARDVSAGGGVAREAGGPVGKRRPEPETNMAAGGRPPTQGIASDAPVADGVWDGCSSAVELPRWWQLWVGSGGGMVVDCEELLWGWFPFVDEDFSPDAEKAAGWFSNWGKEADRGHQEDALYDDIWQLKHVNEIPSRCR